MYVSDSDCQYDLGVECHGQIYIKSIGMPFNANYYFIQFDGMNYDISLSLYQRQCLFDHRGDISHLNLLSGFNPHRR